MDLREILAQNLKKFQTFIDAVHVSRRKLELSGGSHGGHGFYDHDIIVAQYSALIAPEIRMGEQAWIAALLHSLDRLYKADAEAKIAELLNHLPAGYFAPSEVSEIFEAVMRHDLPNSEEDSLVQIVLQDADRLANIGALVITRSPKLRPNIPACELGFISKSHPMSTFKNPRSDLDNLRHVLEWEHDPKYGLRLQKAKGLGKKHFRYIRGYIEKVASDLEEVGLEPWLSK